MVLDITAQNTGVNFSPGSTMEEIAQNVRMIITTLKGSVPLDREFGINASALDKPIVVAQATLSSEIMEAVSKYEPRARVTKIVYQGKEQEGLLEPTVRIEVVE